LILLEGTHGDYRSARRPSFTNNGSSCGRHSRAGQSQVSAEVERDQIPNDFSPKTSHGRTHPDLIKRDIKTLKIVEISLIRPLPTADEIVSAKQLAEIEPGPIPKELMPIPMPKIKITETHLGLIKACGVV
jgi:hypothetical protein